MFRILPYSPDGIFIKLYELEKRCYTNPEDHFPSWREYRDWINENNVEIFVHTVDDIWVGSLVCCRGNIPFPGKEKWFGWFRNQLNDSVYISGICVIPEYRNTGITRILFGLLKSQYSCRIVTRTRKENYRMQRILERRGYSRIGKAQRRDDGKWFWYELKSKTT